MNPIYRIEKGSGVGIICCSDGRKREKTEELSSGTEVEARTECDLELRSLLEKLESLGLQPQLSPCIYARNGASAGSGRERAQALMDFYRDDSIKAIFDISGGNAANEVLPFLDYSVIAGTDKLFWGYSDLTVILNAVYAKTGKASVLWQVRNLLYDHGEEQKTALEEALSESARDCGTGDGKGEKAEKEAAKADALFSFPFHFINSSRMEGVVAGGNLRCLLKLAGTEFWPDMRGKLLLLESRSGGEALIASGLAQLEQMGVFRQISGLLLGTFTELEGSVPGAEERLAALVREHAGPELPVAKTQRIGHGTDSAAVMIGGWMRLENGRPVLKRPGPAGSVHGPV